MSWNGLTVESKLFCDYQNKSISKKAVWWFDYLFKAAPKYWFYTFQDYLRSIRGTF
jgi:hypothetical protein